MCTHSHFGSSFLVQASEMFALRVRLAAPAFAVLAAGVQPPQFNSRTWTFHKLAQVPVQCVIDDTLERLIVKFEVPKEYGDYLDSKGMRQAGHLAQIKSKEALHTLVTEKVNAASTVPLRDDDLTSLKLRVEAMWKASQKYFETSVQQESKSDSSTSRPVGSTERAAKIKAYEIRNNAVLTQSLQPSRSL